MKADRQPKPFRKRDHGYALPMVLFLSTIGLITLGAALNRSSQSAVMNERKNQLSRTVNAAEAATEKVLGQMLFDFKADGERRVYGQLANYRDMIPSSTEDNLWSGFQFMDHFGRAGKTYVARITTEKYVDLNSKYKGLKGFASTYRITSNTKQTDGLYPITNAVMQEVQLASIPVFQFAIFYNSLLEFTWAAPLTIRGRVHANADVFTGSSAPLTFTEDITATGVIQKRSWSGHNLSRMTGSINYRGNRETNVNSMTLPIGTNNTAAAVREILNRPPSGENMASPMGQQRFYNKSELAIVVGNGNINLQVKRSFDAAPITIAATNAAYFLSTDKALRDDREAKIMRLTEIDVGRFRTWAATNSEVISKLGAGNPPNIIFVEDNRTTSSGEKTAVRLINGRTLPGRGLTVATPNPLYVRGHYNQPNNSFLGTTNTSNVKPASLISDALTILSPNWTDGRSGGAGAAIAGGSGIGSGSLRGAPRSRGGSASRGGSSARSSGRSSSASSRGGRLGGSFGGGFGGGGRSGGISGGPGSGGSGRGSSSLGPGAGSGRGGISRGGVTSGPDRAGSRGGSTARTSGGSSSRTSGGPTGSGGGTSGSGGGGVSGTGTSGGGAAGTIDTSFGGTPSTPSLSHRNATDTTVNAAILTGNVPSAGPTGLSPQSGGVHNLPRLLEHWGDGADSLTLNGSMVNLFSSVRAIAPFRNPGIYYYAPTRDFNFDPNFKDVTKLPPGTPELRTLIRGKWKNILPGRAY